MKNIVLLVVAAYLLVAALAVSAGGQHEASGVIKSIDMTAKKITISHGPIKTLGMMGMTMAFAVYDPAMIDDVKKGNKIDFVVEVDKSGGFTIMELEVTN